MFYGDLDEPELLLSAWSYFTDF